ncbi:C4-dicarboxylic acid transporter DauA [Shewanella sp. Isolate7]|uniref:C4-dicarboxylic acid transporter DauA n=1 Tax=Shewanella sp. Isolate7 TaxID=2908528 RepID=UPI001EFC8553|nr:C4-dicarboxylic acid transporter DauA [Shewanella sp. Isolate7]MCG9721831.1 C4-dicarboxylic acid transporter DauA [Shewanella sp. Isolate7]
MLSALKKSISAKPSTQEIQTNILAGLTVGVIALPLSMALAIASGVPPQHGLYTAMIAGIVIALCGGSKVNISGPTAAFVVILLPIVQQFGLGGLLLSGLMAGVILLLMGLGKLGKLIEIVPYPVTVGFTAGIGVVIATFQIKDFFGLEVAAGGEHYLEKLSYIAQALTSINWQETLVGGLTLAVLLAWPRLKSKVPAHLAALLVGALFAWIMTQMLGDFSVATIGSRFHYELDGVLGSGIPPIMPSFEWPWNLPGADGQPIGMSFELVRELLPSAITIAILGALESLLCAVVADGMSGKKHNPNDELIGQGLGNMLVPLFGGIPATAAIARTAANVKAGGSMPLASVVHGLFILAGILLLAPLLSYIPMASMAALLLVVAWNMSEAKHFARTLKVAPRDDVLILLLCFALTVLFDMTIAVAVGMGLAAMLFIRRSISLTDARAVETNHQAYQVPDSVVVYDINGPLFFGSAHKALKTIALVRPDVRVVILDMSEVTLLDMSAIVAMESIAQDLSAKRVGLIINNLQPRMLLKLRRAGIRKRRGQVEYARTMDDSFTLARRMAAQE